jgi:transcriptional regulator with XRE-family HTH domain
MGLHYPDLQALVLGLAAQHHNGAIYPMAARTKRVDGHGLSAATLDKWKQGIVKNPELSSLMILADAYGLDRGEVIELATRRQRFRRRRLACLVAALGLATTAWGSAPAQAEHDTTGRSHGAVWKDSVNFWRRVYKRGGRGNPHPPGSGFPLLTAWAC